MKSEKAIIIDFETLPIKPRPEYPPKPVSVAIKWPDDATYKLMAWGHEGGGNNCTEKEAYGEYRKARNSKYPLLFQNGMFDQDVAEVAWDLTLVPWERFHDTLFLIFLDNPHAESLSLKPSAERLLGIKPEEQDRMFDWIIANVPEAKRKPSEAGAYIYKCPYQIVKPYHKGDLVRTGKIFNLLYPRIVAAGMLEAYERERRLMPILLRNAREGMGLAEEKLAKDVPLMEAGVTKADEWIRKRLKTPDLNIDSDQQLAQALLSSGVVHQQDFARTPKGKLSVSNKTLTVDKFQDKRVFHVLRYRGQMSTSIDMFGKPWLALSGGRGLIHPDWSQVRSPKNDKNDTKGARSGRIICAKPNFLNIPKKWKRAMSAGYQHPAFLKVPELPFMRTYCLPDKGQVWGRRDFNQQELRLFGHFEEGPVMQGFLNDPKFDIHEDVRAEAERRLIEEELREEFDRDTAKTCVFGRLYGQGITGLMMALKLREDERPVAQLIQKAINTAVPSIKELDDELKRLGRNGDPIRTWGGRLYYCEPPQYSAKYGRDMTFEYKLLNYLCQGSGADVTKEVICRYDEHPKRVGRLIVTVYDEINLSIPPKALKQEMALLRDVMRSIETDVPMLSDGEVGPNWGTLEKFAI